MKSGNVVEYRIRLVDKIGQERVEGLEQSNKVRTFDIDYLKRVKRIFSRRARHYKRLRGI
jgi:isocitrate dehydrogenase kinase/phosphatase